MICTISSFNSSTEIGFQRSGSSLGMLFLVRMKQPVNCGSSSVSIKFHYRLRYPSFLDAKYACMIKDVQQSQN